MKIITTNVLKTLGEINKKLDANLTTKEEIEHIQIRLRKIEKYLEDTIDFNAPKNYQIEDRKKY